MSEFVGPGVKVIEGEIEGTINAVVSSVNNFACKVTALFEQGLRGLEKFCNNETRCPAETRILRQNLFQASSSAYAFIDRVDDVSCRFHSSTRIERIKRAAEVGDFNELGDFLDDVIAILADAESMHRQFKEDCGEVRKSADDAAERCSRKANKAKRKKKITQVKGGATAVGGFAAVGVGVTGVVTSIVLGVVTAGVAVPIVLGITAGAAVVVGGTVGVTSTAVTVHTANGYEALRETLQRYSSTFREIAQDALRLLNAVSEQRELMERTRKISDDVERYWRNHRVRESFLMAVDVMFEKGALMHNQTAPCRDKVKQVKERLKQVL